MPCVHRVNALSTCLGFMQFGFPNPVKKKERSKFETGDFKNDGNERALVYGVIY